MCLLFQSSYHNREKVNTDMAFSTNFIHNYQFLFYIHSISTSVILLFMVIDEKICVYVIFMHVFKLFEADN